MKILITNAGLNIYAGTEMYVYTIAKALQARGHEVVCYSPQLGTVADRLLEEHILVTDDLEKLQGDFDIIHGQHYAETLEAAVRFPEIPIFQLIHGVLPWQEQPLPTGIVNHYGAVSEEIKQSLMMKHGILADKVRIIRNPVDTQRFRHDRARENRSIQKVLFLSNRANEQVLRTVREACELGGYEFNWVGAANSPTWSVEDCMADSDLVITLGRGVLEALSMGKPVVVYDYNGGDGLVTDKNFDTLRKKNFSGRTFGNQYTPQELLREMRLAQWVSIESVSERVISEHRSESIAEQLEAYYNEIKMQPFHSRTTAEIRTLLNDCYRRLLHWKNIDAKIAQANLKYLTELTQLQQNELLDSRNQMSSMQNDIEYMEELLVERSKVIKPVEEKANVLEEEKLSLENEIFELRADVEQKEANTRYLIELMAEKEKELHAVYSSKAWRLITSYRTNKHRAKKALRNPGWATRKIKEKLFGVSIPANSYQPPVTTTSENPLISVVIPIYDRVEELRQSIQSILNQSFQDFELLLVTDGSPERTLAVVDSFKDHPKVRIFKYFNNSGNAVRGRNKAIKEARGKYLAFQDSDDIADPNRLERSLQYMEKFKADVVYGGWRALMDGSRTIDGLENGQEVMSPDCDLQMLQEICVPCQSTVMCRLDKLRQVGGLKTKMRYREDHELWLRLAYNGAKFKTIPTVLTNLRLHTNNLELSFKDTDDKWFKLMQEEYKLIRPLGPKIGYVIPGCGISGGIAVICHHVNRLLDIGFDVVMISEDEGHSISWFPNQRVEVIPLKEAPNNFDILVATGWSTAFTVNHMSANRKFYFVQSDESRFYPDGSREQKKALETYTFDFEYMTEALWIKKWLKDRFGHEALYVPNGMDQSIFHQTTPLEPKGNKIRVLLEGPIDIPFKGMADAFAAVNHLDCEVWCISSAGKPKPEWRCDRFFEKVPMLQMKEIYSSCDILLKLSRVEGFFGPPMEMMACGGTAVVGDVTGHDEYIIDGYNALVVPLGDPDAAHHALKRLISDRDLLDQLKSNGKKTADEWKWETTIDTLEQALSTEKMLGTSGQ